MKFAVVVSFILACFVIASAGCSAASRRSVPGAGSDNVDAAFVVSGGEHSGSCRVCSDDLHDVLDCESRAVIKQCGEGAACGAGGECVAPCDAARDNKSSIGCDYYAVTPDAWSNIPEFNAGTSDGSCFVAFVTNTWDQAIGVELEFDGKIVNGGMHAYIPHGSGSEITYEPVPKEEIPAGQMAIVFLAHHGAHAEAKTLCPKGVSPAFVDRDTGRHGTGFGHAIRISTSAPAVVYDVYPYGGAASYITSATLLLPTSVWDTNYVAATTLETTTFSATAKRPSGLTIVAHEDDTEVTLRPTKTVIARGGVRGTQAGKPKVYSLARGELLHLMQLEDLTGSAIASNKPIGVWGEHYCMQIPEHATACDPGHQQLPPVKALGSEYVAVRYRGRGGGEEVVPWRLVGVVDGTKLTYDPPQPGAPKTLNSGELRVFSGPGPFTVKSQDDEHPFYVAAHMTGQSAGHGGTGDPETVNVVPPQQYLTRYIFFTDPTYGETNVVVIRKKGPRKEDGFADVELDCAGPLTGWEPVDGNGSYEYTRVDLQHEGSTVGECDNGRHTISSDLPFGITVWGWDSYVSYAYPAGASVKPINAVVVPTSPK